MAKLKVRTLADLSTLLQGNLQTRKRELTTLRFLSSRVRGHEQNIILRSGVVLLYSHWEGFIKHAVRCYIAFINCKGLRCRDLAPSLAGLALRSLITQAKDTVHKHHGRTKLVEAFWSITPQSFVLSAIGGDDDDDEQSEDDSEERDDTIRSSNIKWDILQDILTLLRISPDDYELKKARIDDELLKARNKVAHGSLTVPLSLQDYQSLQDTIIELLERFGDDVFDLAENERYRA